MRDLTDSEILSLTVARYCVREGKPCGPRVTGKLVALIDDLTKTERDDSLSVPKEKNG